MNLVTAAAFDPSVADYRATSPSEWGGVLDQNASRLSLKCLCS